MRDTSFELFSAGKAPSQIRAEVWRAAKGLKNGSCCSFVRSPEALYLNLP